jgi:hypothetical protein
MKAANREKVWSEEAKNLTFQAVNKAGFTKRYFRGLRDIVFVTEPEAAALYSIKYFMAEEEDGEILRVYSLSQMAFSIADR